MALASIRPEHVIMAAVMRQRKAAMPALPWRKWLAAHFASYTTAPFADRHVRYWEWLTALHPGVRPRPRVETWPRAGAKSSTVELGCAYLGSQPEPVRHYVLYVSKTQAQANKHVQSIAAMLERVGVTRATNQYGSSKGWRHEEIRTANGFNVTAFGLDSGMRGVKLDEYRPDIIIFDDIDDRLDTPETVQKKIDVLTTTILPSGSSDCAVIVVQNKVHEDSIVSRLCDGRADFLHDRLPPTVEPAVRDLEVERQIDDDGMPRYVITDGTSTWAGQSLATCEHQINSWGLTAFLREAQHEVGIVEDAPLKAEWFGVTPVDPHYVAIVQAWDTAFKTGSGNDYSVCLTLGIALDGYDILDVWRDRVEFPELERAASDQATIWQARFSTLPYTLLVEDKASGQSLIQALQRRTRIPVQAVSASRENEKLQRVNEIAPTVQARRVRLPAYAHWRAQFLSEVTSFSATSTGHDDQVDAFAMAVRRAVGLDRSAGASVEAASYIAQPSATHQRRRPRGR